MVLVVLCCASGKVKIGCWLGRGRARLRRGAKVAKLQSRQLPRRFSRPSQPARQAGGRRRARKDSYPILSHCYNIHAITTLSLLHPHQHYLCVSPLLFFSFSVFRFIHRPPAPPPPTTSTRASRCHASPSAAQSSLSRTRTQAADAPALLSQPAAQHPRNTASSPSSSQSSQHSPHLHHHPPTTLLSPSSRQRRLTCDV